MNVELSMKVYIDGWAQGFPVMLISSEELLKADETDFRTAMGFFAFSLNMSSEFFTIMEPLYETLKVYCQFCDQVVVGANRYDKLSWMEVAVKYEDTCYGILSGQPMTTGDKLSAAIMFSPLSSDADVEAAKHNMLSTINENVDDDETDNASLVSGDGWYDGPMPNPRHFS